MQANVSGCREEQRRVSALRPLCDWVGIVTPLWFGKGSGNTKRTATALQSSQELWERVCRDLHGGLSHKTSVCFSCFHVGLRYPQGVEEQTRMN